MDMKKTAKATWIWYPGDFEVWLGNIFNNRRIERGAMLPPFWKQDSHYPTVEFSKSFTLDSEETITIAAEGRYNLALDGKLYAVGDSFTIPAGEHRITLKVWNQATPPAIFIEPGYAAGHLHTGRHPLQRLHLAGNLRGQAVD